MSDPCPTCMVPWSTDAGVRYCIYCKPLYLVPVTKMSEHIIKAAGGKMYKVPSFKSIDVESISVWWNGLVRVKPGEYTVKCDSNGIYVLTNDVLPPGTSVTLKWSNN